MPGDNQGHLIKRYRMPGSYTEDLSLKGLTHREVVSLREQYGKNIFYAEPPRRLYHIALDLFREPMFILLILAAVLYLFLGDAGEAAMMLTATLLVGAISVYQDAKSTNAVKALQQFTQPQVSVIREGKQLTIISEELVPGDIIILEEGMHIPADADILQQNDFSVNESVITGESLPVEKNMPGTDQKIYQGTTVNSGKAIAAVTATGNNTILGKLGKKVGSYQPPKTLLQLQIGKFVKRLALFGFSAFILILLVNFYIHRDFVTSLLFALTLAMSVIPEEIPVAFSSFMALGAYKMSRVGIISRQPQILENLGAVSVVCLDKTGTITENKMKVQLLYDIAADLLTEPGPGTGNVLYYAVLASESDPFDAMEKAIWDAYTKNQTADPQLPGKIHEYPLEGRPPMMTHVYSINRNVTAAAKGAPERIFRVCRMKEEDVQKAESISRSMTAQGYRVIAVASAVHDGNLFPEQQDNFNWRFEGLLALYDPPKPHIKKIFKQFETAVIDVKIITGDHPATTVTIAAQAGIDHQQKYFTGDAIMAMTDSELSIAVEKCSIFARMFPDAKLRVIEALKANGEIVAMTGDGVNDGPALKASDIGIAMGKRGTGIARQAADLVLTDDNLEKIIVAVREGRKIFSNLKKAVRYIISIHVPIILIASVPLLLGWKYPNIFTPVHVIFLELIMGPTCSIFFEKEPVEENLMLQAPRNRNSGLFSNKELFVSILQGCIIAAGILALYYYYMNIGSSMEQVRTVVFTTLILCNMLLTFTNRSFSQTLLHTLRYKNNLAPFVPLLSAILLIGQQYIPSVKNLFGLSAINAGIFFTCFAVAVATVWWFEIYKASGKKIQ